MQGLGRSVLDTERAHEDVAGGMREERSRGARARGAGRSGKASTGEQS